MKLKGIIPDATVFADTGNEKPETYDFIEWFSGWLMANSMPPITVVRYYLKGASKVRPRVSSTIPSFVKRNTYSPLWLFLVASEYFRQNYAYTNLGEECLTLGGLPGAAYGKHNCSLKWKIDPFERWIKENYTDPVQVWVGIHAGETSRLFTKKGVEKESYVEGLGYKCYPLIDWKLGQTDCENLIKSMLPKAPPKSACWFCPYAKPSEVKDLSVKNPELYQLGCEMESNAKTENTNLGRGFSWKTVLDLPEYEQLSLDLFAETRSCTCIE